MPLLTCSALPALLLSGTLSALAEPPGEPRLPNIIVLGSAPDSPIEPMLDRQDLDDRAGADLAEVLRGLSGVSASRMGGHGLEPFIRGQSQGQINVRIDGMELHGACPNRMDPPTAFAQPSSIDRVTVHKGVQSLRNGPGGSGGAVLIERQLRWDPIGLAGRVALNGSDNAEFWQVAADVSGAHDRFAWRALASSEDRRSYTDGAGTQVRSSFVRDSASLLLGFAASAQQRSELSLDFSDTRDVLYAGAGMDAPKDRLQAWKLAHSADFDRLSLRASAWRAEVDHVMDNFSLRAQTGMFMRVPATADSHGVELASDIAVGDWNLELGLQQAALERLAIRSAGMNAAALTMRNALLWPQAELERRGVFVEMRGPLSTRSSLTAGLRWDRFDADALRANEPVNMNLPAAASFYRSYYGTTELRRSDSGLGVLLRLDHRIDNDMLLFAGASRSVRAADSSERYIASTSGAGPTRWIGNPGLENERHLQLDSGLIWSPGQTRYSAVLFVDRVGDYILRDRARGQAGLLLADGATVYRNIDAQLRGAEFEAEWRLGSIVKLEAQLDYVRGRNRSDQRALAQIAPLSFALRLSSATAAGEFSARLRGADRQSRVDASGLTGSGLDARQTPGWMTLDLGWSIEHAAQRVRIGIDNVFNRLYAEHLNRANQDPFNPDPIQVNEPGRSLRISWEYRF